MRAWGGRELERGGKADRWVEWRTEQREWRRKAGAACVCVCVFGERDQKSKRISSHRIESSLSDRSEISEEKQQGQRYRAVEADEDRTTGWQNREKDNRGIFLSRLFDQAGFHGDNMGAVVGTLTMQTKQRRRPSRGTSTLVRKRWREDRRATERDQTERERESRGNKMRI